MSKKKVSGPPEWQKDMEKLLGAGQEPAPEYHEYQKKFAKAVSSYSVTAEEYMELTKSPYHQQAAKEFNEALHKSYVEAMKLEEQQALKAEEQTKTLKKAGELLKHQYEKNLLFAKNYGVSPATMSEIIAKADATKIPAGVSASYTDLEAKLMETLGKKYAAMLDNSVKAGAIKGYKIKSSSLDDKNQLHAEIEMPLSTQYIGMDLSNDAKLDWENASISGKWPADHVKGTNIDGVMIDDNAEMNLPIPITESGPLFAAMFDKGEGSKIKTAFEVESMKIMPPGMSIKTSVDEKTGDMHYTIFNNGPDPISVMTAEETAKAAFVANNLFYDQSQNPCAEINLPVPSYKMEFHPVKSPAYMNPLPLDMTAAHFELFIQEYSRRKNELGVGDWALAEWCNQMTPPCCDRITPLQISSYTGEDTYFKSIVNHHFPHLADIKLEPEERVELTLTGLTKQEADAMLKYHQKTHSAKPVLVSTKKLKDLGTGAKAVVKWEFDSSSMAYNGTAVKYIAQLNTDGTVSCNCQGYVIQKKNADGSPKKRRCKHTDAVADQVDVHTLFKKWKKGEDLGPDFVAEGSTTAVHKAVNELVYSAKRIVEI
jgi:hypothetical protein